RQAAKEIDARLFRALLVLDARDQVFQLLGIARVARALDDAAFVESLLVSVDRLAHLSQRAPQVLLLRALHDELVERQRDRRQHGDDRHRDDQLYQREALHCAGGFKPPKGTSTGAAGGGAAGAAAAAAAAAAPVSSDGLPVADGSNGGDGKIPAPAPPRRGMPVWASVPAANSTEPASGRASVRCRRGVMSSTISERIFLSELFEKSRPAIGRSPRPGTLSAL